MSDTEKKSIASDKTAVEEAKQRWKVRSIEEARLMERLIVADANEVPAPPIEDHRRIEDD